MNACNSRLIFKLFITSSFRYDELLIYRKQLKKLKFKDLEDFERF